eukprot:CAMPEP_0114284930 /NCGR_PEP_ID=MMETSP0059-20121206/4909_1 /TAXON_ID=36894 /ORGANISM="Pyramimonas parkeae, Strain CCMP726" /LENGTH=124 /DNA_ID=CAMNT_0001405781 /DNA_START=408 /DNA_END=782 /DNA_ORIENTATION=+
MSIVQQMVDHQQQPKHQVWKEENCRPCDSSSRWSSDISCRDVEPTGQDIHSVPEAVATPGELYVEKRVRSLDDMDDYLGARARLLTLTRRQNHLMKEMMNSSSSTSDNKCDSLVRAAIASRASL